MQKTRTKQHASGGRSSGRAGTTVQRWDAARRKPHAPQLVGRGKAVAVEILTGPQGDTLGMVTLAAEALDDGAVQETMRTLAALLSARADWTGVED